MPPTRPHSTGNFGFWVVLCGVFIIAFLCTQFFGSNVKHEGDTRHLTIQQMRWNMIQSCQDAIDKSKHLWPPEMQKYASAARAKCLDDF
jgi:hypothetical protein